MVTIQKIFRNFVFSETLKGISNTLQHFTFAQPSVDEIVGGGGGGGEDPDDSPLDIKCGSEITWYKKG